MSPTDIATPTAHTFRPGPGELVHLSARELSGLGDARAAVAALTTALRSGQIDPETDGPRLFSPGRPGSEFLLMPTANSELSGVKVITLTPDNPSRGMPSVQGVYVVFDGHRNAPVAVLDAAELTLIRTPATTTMAARHLLAITRGLDTGATLTPDQDVHAERVVVFGTGPQARRHVAYVHALLAPADITVVGRRPDTVADMVDTARARGIPVHAAADLPSELSRADLIVCATASPTPLFDDRDVADTAVVCGIGVHGLGKAELPPALIARADIVVEGRASALRESGNLRQARPLEHWEQAARVGALANLQDLVAGHFTHRPGHPAVYSGVGMAWEDLVTAAHLLTKHAQHPQHAATPHADLAAPVLGEPNHHPS